MVDGLDECIQTEYSWKPGKNNNRENFLIELKNCTVRTTSRVLIVSRDEIDIRSQLLPTIDGLMEQSMFECKISKDDVHHDISLFSKSVVERKLPNKDPHLQKELATQITEKCDGNFLWIRLQETNLRPGKNRKALLKAVEDMPPELKQVFMRSQLDISKLPDHDRYRAQAILRWVTFALRPLTVLEITEALAVTDDDDDGCNGQGCDSLQVDLLPDEIDRDYVDDQILGLCGSLLELRSTNSDQQMESRTIHLIHFSVRQYLPSTTDTLFQPSIANIISFSNQMDQNNQLASTCLRNLNDRKSWERVNRQDCEKQSYSFLDYAVRSWYLHVSPTGDKYRNVVQLVMDFVHGGNSNWNTWRTRYESEKVESASDTGFLGEGPASSIYYLSLFGLFEPLQLLLKNGENEVNKTGGYYRSALQAACAEGHTTVVDLLTKENIDLDAQGGKFGSAINAAAALGYKEILYHLINLGASLILNNKDGQTTINLASQNGHVDVVKLLLQSGADAAVPDNDRWTPLNSAAYNGHVDMVKLLLESGADVAVPTNNGWTPLNSAASKGHVDIVKLLLENGADVAVPDNDGSTALHAAVSSGHETIVKLLIDNHASLSSLNTMSETVLHLASRSNSSALVSTLIMHDADPLLIDDYGRTSLDWAAAYEPCFQAMGHYTRNYSTTSPDVSQVRLRKTLMKLVRQCQQEEQSGPFYLLGHILLFLDNLTAACIAFERNLSEKQNNLIHQAYCNRCDSTSNIKGYRYVCMSCTDINLCEACFKQFHNDMTFKRCENHEFVKIPREIWKDLKPDCIDEKENTLQMWLAEIYEKYKLM